MSQYFKNERACRDIKTEKAQEQDWDGNLATKLNTTSITTAHKYRFLVLCFYSSYIYTYVYRVVMEVVFNSLQL